MCLHISKHQAEIRINRNPIPVFKLAHTEAYVYPDGRIEPRFTSYYRRFPYLTDKIMKEPEYQRTFDDVKNFKKKSFCYSSEYSLSLVHGFHSFAMLKDAISQKEKVVYGEDVSILKFVIPANTRYVLGRFGNEDKKCYLSHQLKFVKEIKGCEFRSVTYVKKFA